MTNEYDAFNALDDMAARGGHPLAGAVIPINFRTGVIPPGIVTGLGLMFENGREYVGIQADFAGPVVNVTGDIALTRLFWTLPGFAEFVAGVQAMIEKNGHMTTFTAELDRALMAAREIAAGTPEN